MPVEYTPRFSSSFETKSSLLKDVYRAQVLGLQRTSHPQEQHMRYCDLRVKGSEIRFSDRGEGVRSYPPRKIQLIEELSHS